jgi:nucleoside-diphosphate kinase
MSKDVPVLGFECEYYDSISNVIKILFLKFHSEDGTIELFESDPDRVYLKRIKYDGITLQDLFIGNTVSIYKKLMFIKSYCNTSTQKFFIAMEIRFLCIIENNSIPAFLDIIASSRKYELRIGRMKTVTTDIPNDGIKSGDLVVELVGLSGNSHSKFDDFMSTSIEGVTMTESSYELVSNIISSKGKAKIPSYCTLCLVKPHVVKSDTISGVLKDILAAGFDISSMASVHLNPSMCDEIFDAYKDVVPKYGDLITHMTSAPCIAIMITGYKEDTVNEFRNLCGPYVPDVARALRPSSLRAKYGKDSTLNVVHCSDLAEHGLPECKYIFDTILSLA